MAKQITLDDIELKQMRFHFNHSKEVTDGEGDPTVTYYPARVEFIAVVKGGDVVKRVTDSVLVGTGKDTAYTNKELYTLLNSMNSTISKALKDMVMAELEEDVTQ